MEDGFPALDPVKDIVQVIGLIMGDKHRYAPSNRLGRGIPVDLFGAGIPAQYDTIEGLSDDGIV